MKLLLALLSASLLLDAADADRWRGLILDATAPADAVAALGQPATDKPDRLFLPAIRKWFAPGLNKKELRKQSFKGIEGFDGVDLYYRDEKLVVIQLRGPKGIEPTALNNIYAMEFDPYSEAMLGGIPESDRRTGSRNAGHFPPEYELVAIGDRSIVAAGISNSGLVAVLAPGAGGGFPGKVKTVQLISKTLQNRAGEDLLK